MDKIVITGLEVFAHHGVYEQEKLKGQKFIINAEFEIDTLTAGLSDEIDDTLDYGKVCEFINEYMVVNQFNLLEALINSLARKLLVTFERIKSLSLEICKPDAPIPVKFNTVSVKIKRSRHTAFISVGSNMGERETYIRNAIDNLAADECIKMLSVSDLIETKPYGVTDQDDFLNGVFKIETLYSPEELLARLHIEEQEAGRKRLMRWGPRTLDLDIVFYDNLIMSTDTLVIPHPDMSNRSFVLDPICQIDPYVIHPRLMLTVQELSHKLKSAEK
ncbi:MAG: 2-amino-4-hydroxy-6-hydroxymethyldihydropteridine diphosphokinase [Lachnospiraceae bacterium]|nr:2-amino-4-hydroxy-6-hydroxymethyldihydropteridine diphosphokinase [Lachnospiraceae bacterium]